MENKTATARAAYEAASAARVAFYNANVASWTPGVDQAYRLLANAEADLFSAWRSAETGLTVDEIEAAVCGAIHSARD